MDLTTYIANHIDPEGDYLYRLYRATNLHTLHGRMASGHLQGRLLKMLVQMTQAKRVLEVGTFSGYSAICLAEGLPDDGILYTFEINDEQEDFTRPWIEGSAVANKIRFTIGDAITEAPRLGITFDLVFIDGDKRTYGIRRFNDLVATDPRVEKVILPLRDGLTLIRKLEGNCMGEKVKE